MTATFQMFAITLGTLEFNPAVLTPDTLRYNGVVEDDWVLAKGSTFSMSETLFGYTNGVEVYASPDALSFRQVATDLRSEKILGPELITRYSLANLPGEWFSVDLDFGIRIDSLTDLPPEDDSLWETFTRDLKYKDTAPELRASLTYGDLEGRNLYVELYRRKDLSGQMLLCVGRITRALSNGGEDEDDVDVLESVLDEWECDLSDIISIGNRLASSIFRTGGN